MTSAMDELREAFHGMAVQPLNDSIHKRFDRLYAAIQTVLGEGEVVQEEMPTYEEAVQVAHNHLRHAEDLSKEWRHDPKEDGEYVERINADAHLSRAWSALAIVLPTSPFVMEMQRSE